MQKDTTIYEGSSGSTSYSVAMIARLMGLKCKIVIPDDLSNEKLNLLKTTGCELVVTKQCPISNFKDNYVRLTKKLSEEDSKGYYINQFYNTNNYKTHFAQTGPEIWKQLKGNIDIFISAAGTGGTIAGISNFLKRKNNKINVYLADPPGSGLHSYVKNNVMYTPEESESRRKKYRYYSIIEGIGVNFLTDNFKEAIIDDSFKISDDEAIYMARYLYEKDGIFIGGSSAVNLCACLKAAKKEGKGKKIVTILYDSGIRYVSKLYDYSVQVNTTSINQIYDTENFE